MVAAAKVLGEDTIQAAGIYRLSVEQYHRMISPDILIEGDPVEMVEGLLLHKWARRTSSSDGSFYLDELYQLSVEQYHAIGRLGILAPEDCVELLEGILVRKMTKNDPHIAAARRCRRAIEPLLPTGRFYESEQPVVLADSEPEPDGVVIVGSPFDAWLIKPHPLDIDLIIEVSETSLTLDRTFKLRSYARAGIVCYWIINLIDRQIEVHTQPDSSAEGSVYLDRQIFKPGQRVPLVIEKKTIAEIAAGDLLPV